MIYREEALKDGYLACNIEECKILYRGELNTLIDGTRCPYLKLSGGRITTDDEIIKTVDGVLVVSVPPYSLFIPYDTKKIDDANEIISLEPIEQHNSSQLLGSTNRWLYVMASLDQIEKALMLRRKENSNEQ